MRSYVIDTLFDSEYYIGDTEEIETTEKVLRQAPDIKREIRSLLGNQDIILQPITKKPDGHGRFEQPSNASGRRKPMENQISTRPGQLHGAIRPDGRWQRQTYHSRSATALPLLCPTLGPHIASVCGLDLSQEYRIAIALYGPPTAFSISTTRQLY